MNLQQLLAIAPLAGARAALFIDPLNVAMKRYEVNSPARQAAFLAQILHESSYLAAMSENLNYSPASLMSTFNTPTALRFDAERAALYGRTAAHPANQQMIANIAYANRMGNGSIESGDGWRYRGRGPGQLTGKRNYLAAGMALGLDLVEHPDLVAQPENGCLAFGWFWAEGNPTGKSLNPLADVSQIQRISTAVNGGKNGLTERLALTARALKELSK